MVIPALGGHARELARTTFDTRLLLKHWTWIVPPPFVVWSSDGKWLLTLEQSAPGTFQTCRIIRVFTATGEKQALTAPSQNIYGDGSLALSPDGKTLAFTRTKAAYVSDIYLLPMSKDLLPAGRPERLTFDGKRISGLAWTADGRSLVFASMRGGRLELWRILSKPSSKPVRLMVTGDAPLNPAISRDGHRLVYAHGFGNFNIWRVSLQSKQPGQAVSLIASTRSEFHPRYSPDGKRIAFESDRSGSKEIWVSNEDGSNAIQMTSFGNAWAGSPQWSPDGEKIVFDCNVGGNFDIYVIKSQGGQPVRLTTSPANHIRPSWSHDGKWIYFSSNRTGTNQIWKVSSRGGREIQVTKNGGLLAFESTDGVTLYYLKEDPARMAGLGGNPYWNEGDLWAMPVSGGAETRLLQCTGANFAVVKQGVYFIDDRDEHLKMFGFKTHRIKTITAVPGPIGDEISISPHGQSMIYAKLDHAGSELALVEKFR
jgi:Tol biopolymer transport system component